MLLSTLEPQNVSAMKYDVYIIILQDHSIIFDITHAPALRTFIITIYSLQNAQQLLKSQLVADLVSDLFKSGSSIVLIPFQAL